MAFVVVRIYGILTGAKAIVLSRCGMELRA
jgi:hypothetical protein